MVSSEKSIFFSLRKKKGAHDISCQANVSCFGYFQVKQANDQIKTTTCPRYKYNIHESRRILYKPEITRAFFLTATFPKKDFSDWQHKKALKLEVKLLANFFKVGKIDLWFRFLVT